MFHRRGSVHSSLQMLKTIERISVIGGSSVYIPVFLSAIMQRNVRVKEIVLIGRNEEKLKIVSSFCERLIENVGYPLKIIPTTSLEEGIQNANVIVNHIRVGGLLSRINIEKKPLKFGLIGDESFGAGSFANALKTLPVIMEIGRKVKTINPEAVFINLTNPMGLVVETLTRYTGLRQVIGICEIGNKYRKIASVAFNVPENTVSLQYVGLYHLGLICDVTINDKSVMSEFIEKIESEYIEDFDKRLTDIFKIIPSRALCIYLNKDEYLKKQLKTGRLRSEILFENEAKILNYYRNTDNNEIPDMVYYRNPTWYDEIIVPLIISLNAKTGGEHIICISNKEYLHEFPHDTAVEIPCEVSIKGIKCRFNSRLPELFRGIMITAKESDRLMIDAILNKSYELSLKALTINPFIESFSKAKDFLDHITEEECIKWNDR